MYKPLGAFTARLSDSILASDHHLPLPHHKLDILRSELAGGDYSFLQIKDGKAIEYVKVYNVCGKIVIDRGSEKTTPLPFPCGSSVTFKLTMQGVKATICQMESC